MYETCLGLCYLPIALFKLENSNIQNIYFKHMLW